jgi:superfamily I DNA and/or RNA helicase
VGCLDKINRLLVHRGLYISSSENKKRLMNELEKTMKLDNDPSIINLAQNVINCSNFIENQKLKLENSNVIGVTCASSVSALLSNINCEILIIDEVSQLTEALTLLPIACAKPNKILLIGDSNQLPPALCIQSSSSCMLSETEGDLSRTLFDRLKLLGHNEAILRTQYRCHPSIAEICNKLFYDNIIINGTTHTERLQKIPKLSPIVSLHNDGSDFKLGDSYINKSESELVGNLLFYLSKLFNFNESEKIENSQNDPTIGVICIYKAQVNEIHKRMNSNTNFANIIKKVTISTIDAFQGSEMDIIIICTTKNAPTEFMNNKNRINVAISRAKYHLIIIGNINMLRSSSIWEKVLTFTQQNFQNIQAIYEFVG